jgi:hypothetical protein
MVIGYRASESQYCEVATVPGSIPASPDSLVAEVRKMKQNETGKKRENPLKKILKTNNLDPGPP